jgi:DHA1 family bicyclomycin/chloramphenicol resistance-like MFS transporter
MTEPPAPPPSILRRLVPLLLLLAMVGPLTLNVLQPALPSLSTAFDAPRDRVQLTLSLYILGMAFAQVIAGPLADKYGRRPVIIAALALFVVASFAAVFSKTIETLIVARVFEALGATACLSLSRTIIGDVSDRQTTARIIAYVTMVMVLAPMAAPNVGAFLNARFGWQAIFLFCGLFGVATILAAIWRLSETRPQTLVGTTYGEVGRRTWALTRNPAFLRYAVLASFASACFFIFLGGSPYLVIEKMRRSPEEFAGWYIVLGVGYSLGNLTVARATHLIGPERMMALGNLLLLVGVLLMAGLSLVPVQHPAAVFMPAMFFTFGNGLVLPHSMAAAIQTDRDAGGAASGLMGFAQMLVGASGSYLVAKLPGETALSMALMMFVCGLISAAALPVFWRSKA